MYESTSGHVITPIPVVSDLNSDNNEENIGPEEGKDDDEQSIVTSKTPIAEPAPMIPPLSVIITTDRSLEVTNTVDMYVTAKVL